MKQIQCFDKHLVCQDKTGLTALVPCGHTFCGECAVALEAGFISYSATVHIAFLALFIVLELLLVIVQGTIQLFASVASSGERYSRQHRGLVAGVVNCRPLSAIRQ